MWFAEYNYVSLFLSIVAMTFVQSISTYFNINGNFHTHLIECFIQLLIKLSHLFLFFSDIDVSTYVLQFNCVFLPAIITNL